ncbi:MAG: hypothetical protein IPL96_04870 [Holophagaceae bacterium]|nr:hypothetical protein [Holophagaceae bacterium]
MKDRELVERVKDATDLVALVGQAVKLRKQGSAFVGLCPFHSERSPSFQVVPARGFFHCFGCGKSGDAFQWLMEREGMTFPEALEQLARAAGVEVPKFRERPTAEVDQEARLRGVLEAAQAWFEKQLAGDGAAQDYLRKRGISEAFGRESGFGLAPEGWEGLVGHLRGLGISPELAEQAGLASRSERGTVIDFLRGRLTIPIHDGRGRLVAFGGRILGDGQPKYMNTRETPLPQRGDAVRLPPRQGSAEGRRARGGRLLRRPPAAPGRHPSGRGAPRHGADGGAPPAGGPLHQAAGPLLRR